MNYNNPGYGANPTTTTSGMNNYGATGTTGMGTQTYPQQGMQGGTGGDYVLHPQTNTHQGTSAMAGGGGYGTTGMNPQTNTMGQQGYDTTGMNNQGNTMGQQGYGTTGMNNQGNTMGQQGYGTAGGTGNVVVGEQYVSNQVMSYAVAKKKLSVSKGDWTITDQAGRTVYKVDGRIASMRDKRFLRDGSGTKILTLRKKLVTMHDTWQILAGDSDHVIAKVKKSSLVQFRTAMDVMLAGSTSSKKTPDYQMKGDFFERNLTVFRGAEQCALVTRQITFSSMVLDKDTFGVTVFPGVDQALIFALIVIMDEVYLHDDGDHDHV